MMLDPPKSFFKPLKLDEIESYITQNPNSPHITELNTLYNYLLEFNVAVEEDHIPEIYRIGEILYAYYNANSDNSDISDFSDFSDIRYCSFIDSNLYSILYYIKEMYFRQEMAYGIQTIEGAMAKQDYLTMKHLLYPLYAYGVKHEIDYKIKETYLDQLRNFAYIIKWKTFRLHLPDERKYLLLYTKLKHKIDCAKIQGNTEDLRHAIKECTRIAQEIVFNSREKKQFQKLAKNTEDWILWHRPNMVNALVLDLISISGLFATSWTFQNNYDMFAGAIFMFTCVIAWINRRLRKTIHYPFERE